MNASQLVASGALATNAVEFARSRPNTYLSELYAFLRIPSVSTRPEHVDDVKAAAEWLAGNMRVAGLEDVRIFPTTGHPLVYGEWLHAGADKPTVLFYGHYDVQPADDLSLWQTPPFEPEVRKENIYARGASDDKGQLLMLVKAVEALLRASGELPVNVKFIVEGEEESGGKGLKQFIPEHSDRLSADVAFISDTTMATWDQPSIVYGLRGMCSVNIDVIGPKLDVHSGVYGGGINNPINALLHIIAQLIDEDGHILIPGFYDDVLPLEAEERERIKAYPFDEEEWLQRISGHQIVGRIRVHDAGTDWRTADVGRKRHYRRLHWRWRQDDYSQQSTRQNLDAAGSQSGSARHSGEGDTRYVESISPDSVRVELSAMGASPASLTDYHIPAMKAVEEACSTVFGRNPVYHREGGSIPITGQFQHDLGIETILLGFGGLPHDRIHAPNERFLPAQFLSRHRDGDSLFVNYAKLNQ